MQRFTTRSCNTGQQLNYTSSKCCRRLAAGYSNCSDALLAQATCHTKQSANAATAWLLCIAKQGSGNPPAQAPSDNLGIIHFAGKSAQDLLHLLLVHMSLQD